MQYSVEIRRSRRRTLCLSVEDDLHVLVKAPLFVSSDEIQSFLQKHSAWIEKHVALRRKQQEHAYCFTPEKVVALRKKALLLAQSGIEKYGSQMGVWPAGLKITSAVTRWGSCSGRNRICFSYRIALLPRDAADYVIVHELAHIRQKNHGPLFYAEVAKILPDYKARIALVKRTQQELGL